MKRKELKLHKFKEICSQGVKYLHMWPHTERLVASYMLWAHLVTAYMIYKLTGHLYSEMGPKRIMVNQEDKILNLFINICFHSFKQDLLMLSSEIEVICIDVFRMPQVKAKEACGS